MSSLSLIHIFYIETGKDGKLFINNVYSNFNRTYCENEFDDDIMELISKYTASSEFADLHEEVQKAVSYTHLYEPGAP